VDIRSTVVLPLSKPSFKQHLIRALIDWCEEEGYTPYIMVDVDDGCVVPHEYLNPDNTIVFCVSSEATHNFEMDAQAMRFQARFGDKVQDIYVPLVRIAAFYPKENTDLASYFPLSKSEPVTAKPIEDDIPVFKKL